VQEHSWRKPVNVESAAMLKKAAAIKAEKELKRRVGFAGVRCAMTLNQPNQALEFLRMLDQEFPQDPEVLYLSVHTYSDLSMRASQELANVAPNSYPARQLAAESFECKSMGRRGAGISPNSRGKSAGTRYSLSSRENHSFEAGNAFYSRGCQERI
jgi:hypothetical protein